MTSTNTEDRRKSLAKIHIAKKELAMDDDSYRALLSQAQSGCTSAGDLNKAGRLKMLATMRRLGWPLKNKGRNDQKITALQAQDRKIRKFWLELFEAGVVRDSSEQALNSYVKRQTGIDRLDWLSSAQASKVIESLKSWLARAKK